MPRCWLMMMTKEQIFAIWAPETALWSPWVKPVLFSHLDVTMPEMTIPQPACGVSGAPPTAERAALVLDLPGAEGVFAGLALAARGYQPVPEIAQHQSSSGSASSAGAAVLGRLPRI